LSDDGREYSALTGEAADQCCNDQERVPATRPAGPTDAANHAALDLPALGRNSPKRRTLLASRFQAYLGEVRDYRAARHPLSTEAALQVRQRWAPFVERWGYTAAEVDGGSRVTDQLI
jgi:hypothetical protein